MVAFRSSLAFACLVGGGYLLVGGDDARTAPSPSRPRIVRSASIPATVVATRAQEVPVVPMVEVDEEIVEEEIRGHAPIEDPAELAFVFAVNGVSYVRLSTDERASATGRPRLTEEDEDLTQKSWLEDGGTGDWRDAAEVVTHAVHHPLTDEDWVFVQARRDGSCGDPGFALMAAYRANPDGTVRRVADLSFGSAMIHEVVDLDGDGQPEIILGGGDHAELVDLADEQHVAIDVAERSYGCGC